MWELQLSLEIGYALSRSFTGRLTVFSLDSRSLNKISMPADLKSHNSTDLGSKLLRAFTSFKSSRSKFKNQNPLARNPNLSLSIGTMVPLSSRSDTYYYYYYYYFY
jgi:hypothetical protein